MVISKGFFITLSFFHELGYNVDMVRKTCLLILLGSFFVVLSAVPAHTQEIVNFPQQAIIAASLLGDELMIRVLIDAGVDKDTRTATGDTALHIAVLQKNMAVVRLLLTSGFDPNAINEHGETPLHRAVAVDNEEAARLLLQFRADKNIRNSAGRTPLDEAIREGKRQMIFALR